LKAHAWKVCIRETVSRVRIPLSPPVLSIDPSDIGPIQIAPVPSHKLPHN
jgi:hypothetical protein